MHTSQVRDRYVWCDKKSFTRVLVNLINNSFKFTQTGGTISLSIIETPDSDSQYASYEIRVLDTGIGMSREFVGKMFNAFERERTSTVSGVEGTGLGLAISKSIANSCGGDIGVTSRGDGKGSTFWLWLPCEEIKS